MNTFGIKHKETGLYFNGFAKSGAAQWDSVEKAYAFESELFAKAQASLFKCNDIRVQLKPINLK